MQLYIVGEGLQLIGAIIGLNSIIVSKITIYIGSGLFILGTLIWIIAFFIRFSKNYRSLRKKNKIKSIKDIAAEYGTGMTIFALFFISSITLGVIYFAYQWTHSWIKVVLFLLAYSLVDDLKQYFNSNEIEDEFE